MTNRENFAAAMACRPGDYVPLWELEFHLYDKFSPRPLVLGKKLANLSPAQQDKALADNAEIIVSVANELGFSMVFVPSTYWEIAPGEPAYYWVPKELRMRQIKLIRALAGDDLLLIGGTGGVMGMPSSTQYLEFSYKLFDAPEEIDTLAAKTLAYGIETAKVLRDVGIDAAVTASDIATNQGLFFNPQQMERYILPQLRQWSKAVREMGMYAIMHTDGNINACMEQLADSGLNAIQAIDPVAGMDIRKVKKQVAGRLCLCGNVDCGLLQNGPKEAIYSATAALLEDCKAGGGLVLGASNAVFVETPAENYREMLRAWRDHR